MSEERRITDCARWDAALVLAIIYTSLYAGMVMALILVDVPTSNEKTVDMLIGIMSAIQLAIVGRFFGGSKSADDAQRFLAQGKERMDTVLRDVVSAAVPSVPVKNGESSIKADDVKVEAKGDVTVTRKKK